MSAPVGLPALPPPGGWRVTTQVQQTKYVEGYSQPQQGWTVSFITGYGTTGSVFIPTANYSAANVQALIGAAVTQLDAVSQLTHQS